MINQNVDVAVIGAGPAGLAAAISAHENGATDVLVIDRNNWLGGILPQCIHDGFGVEETGNSMTGPEYAEMYVNLAKKLKISFMQETMVTDINKKLEITTINKKGIQKIKAKSIVLSMGCREKTRWNIMIPGNRPSGIFTAGVAQAFINLYNIMPGKNVIIVGSGDVGLIIARRLKFEGANVLGIVEILPYASGLPRNVVQCLDDYNIPLFLNHTITYIEGRNRLESVTIAQVDKNYKIKKDTEQKIKCDTLLLSLGLIPENELSKKIDIKIDYKTGGPVVDQYFETSQKGVFSCGNCLQVYDTVDFLSIDAKKAGKNAAIKSTEKKYNVIVKNGKNIRYIVPQVIKNSGKIRFTGRVIKPRHSVVLTIKSDKEEIFKKKMRYVNPANMIEFEVDLSENILQSSKEFEVYLDE